MKYLLIHILVWLFIQQTCAQTLKRKAWLGIQCKEANGFLVVDSVLPSSSLYQIGVIKKDTLVSVNDAAIHTINGLIHIANQIFENDIIQVKLKRNDHFTTLKGVALSKQNVSSKWSRVSYESLPVQGCTVRTIMYRPLRGEFHPAILFIPGYNCGSIEGFQNNYNGKMIEGWVKKGYAVYTIEKSGVGDSRDCKACIDVDLQTDIDVYNAAFINMSSQPWVKKDQLFIWGHSMGGIIAPIVAQNKRVKGIMVYGTVFRPWSEFLLEMHRVQKPLTHSMSYSQTEDFVRLIQKVYYEFFVLKKSPEELHLIPAYQKIVETELEYKPGKQDMWGRHWRFWQQLDSINLAQAWQKLDCNVLVLHGATDFIQCSSLEPYLINEAVNQAHPGKSTMITIKGIDHLMMHSENFADAVRNFNQAKFSKGDFNDGVLKETLKWLGSRE